MKVLLNLLIPVKFFLVLLVTILPHQINLISRLLVRPFSPERYVRLRHTLFNWWGRSFARVCGIRVKVEGEPPQGPFFLVSNHVSYVDAPLLGIFLDAVFIGKADLRSWPVLGWMFHTADTIFIDRARRKDLLRVLERVDEFRESGYGIVLFPEGTSGKGDRLLPFKPSLLQYPVARQIPVHWVTIHYRTPEGYPPAHNSVCWWGDELLLPHAVRLLRLPGFEAIVRFGQEPVESEDRKDLCEKLQQAMSAQFLPMA